MRVLLLTADPTPTTRQSGRLFLSLSQAPGVEVDSSVRLVLCQGTGIMLASASSLRQRAMTYPNTAFSAANFFLPRACITISTSTSIKSLNTSSSRAATPVSQRTQSTGPAARSFFSFPPAARPSRRTRTSLPLSQTQQQRRGIVSFSPELGHRLGIDARRQAKPSRPSQLIVVAQCFTPLQGVIIQQLHRELRTRIGHQILRLQHVLPGSKGVDNLLVLHIDVYEQLWALDNAIADLGTKDMKPMVIESFNTLMSGIEGRMAMVVETLMEGLKESYKRQEEGALPPPGTDAVTPIVTSQVDRFLQARIGIATLIRHYLDIIKDPGAQNFVPPSTTLNSNGSSMVAEGGKHNKEEEKNGGPTLPSPSAASWHSASYVVNKRWGSVVENCRIKELIEDCRAEVEALCEHYYQERIPPLVIDEPPGAVATLIPAHFHHTLFEILKNAFKATVESAVRRNLNSMPAIKVRIFPGKEEVCIRVRDYGDGMSLLTMAKATEYLFTSAADYEMEQQRQQQSYQPTMEPMQGMGIGLPVSRLYARHWGGDIRVISVQGWGTDVAIYLSRKDLPENIPIRVFD